METFFPLCGKIPKTFSIVWKKRRKFFPLCGKFAESFSIAWKKWPCFSTVWKIFFHSVENMNLHFQRREATCVQEMISNRKYGLSVNSVPLTLAFRFGTPFALKSSTPYWMYYFLPELNRTSFSHRIEPSAPQYSLENSRVNLFMAFAYSRRNCSFFSLAL